MKITCFGVYAPSVLAPVPLRPRKEEYKLLDSKIEETHNCSDRQNVAREYRVYGKMSQWTSLQVSGQHIDLRI